MSRPSIVETLMKTAFVWSERGTCTRRKVGAVIADGAGRIYAQGYNGALSGLPHCTPHSDYTPCLTSEHAERNAIYSAARKGVALEGLHLYTTDSSCHGCARAIVQVGLKSVTYGRPYRDNAGLALLSTARVTVVEFTKFNDWEYS